MPLPCHPIARCHVLDTSVTPWYGVQSVAQNRGETPKSKIHTLEGGVTTYGRSEQIRPQNVLYLDFYPPLWSNPGAETNLPSAKGSTTGPVTDESPLPETENSGDRIPANPMDRGYRLFYPRGEIDCTKSPFGVYHVENLDYTYRYYHPPSTQFPCCR